MYDLFRYILTPIFLPYLPVDIQKYLPQNIRVSPTIHDCPKNVTIAIDDLAVQFMARESGSESSRELSKYLTVARHSGHNIFLTIQNTAMMDISFLRPKDFVWIQKTTMLAGKQLVHERDDVMQELYAGHLQIMESIPNSYIMRYALVHDPAVFVHISLPEYWNESLGRPYEHYYKGLVI